MPQMSTVIQQLKKERERAAQEVAQLDAALLHLMASAEGVEGPERFPLWQES